MASAQLVPTSTPHLSGCGWRVGVGERGACTLLGPEGPDALRSTDREQTNLRAFLGCPSGKRERYRPYFENYTVDASIFAR